MVVDEDVTGAVTVANMNDTDADGTIDNADSNGVVATSAGRDEVDLMTLLIQKPSNYAGGNVVLTVSHPTQVMLWRDPHKQLPLLEYDTFAGVALINEWNPGCDVRTVWVEVKTPSQSVANVTITASYGSAPNVASDVVKITGVWAQVTAEEFDTKWWNELAGTTWRVDMDQSLQEQLLEVQGSGVRPPRYGNLAHIHNVMLMRYTVTPANVQSLLPRVQFDVTRRIEGKYWKMTYGDVDPQPWYSIDTDNDGVPDAWKTFPSLWEEPNDDAHNTDESAEVLPSGYMFVIDSPGLVNLATTAVEGYHTAWQYLNFREFMRVDVKGSRPSGNTISGSRSSDYRPWHSRVSIEWDGANLKWVRKAIGGQNIIGPGHNALPNSP